MKRSAVNEQDGREMHHLVLTRFNVAFFTDRRPGLDEAWFEYRLQLFSRLSLPAVRNQTRSPDYWLLMVDRETPPSLLRRLARLVGDTAQLVAMDGVYTDAKAAQLVRGCIPNRPLTLVTSRLDSDDGVGARYMESIQRYARTRLGYLNAPWGFQLVGDTVLRQYDYSSPFLSYVERLGADTMPRTVLSVPHHRAFLQRPYHQILEGTAWLQTVHGRNAANTARGYPVSAEQASSALGMPIARIKGAGTPSAGQLAAASMAQALATLRSMTWRLRVSVGSNR